MTDRTPVTDDDRKAHEWADEVEDDQDWARAQAVVRAIRAHVPAPPATLADELRGVDLQMENNDLRRKLNSLADRAEAIEKENRDTDRVLNEAWAERDEARAEVERAKNVAGRESLNLVNAQRDHRAEVERLTAQHTWPKTTSDGHTYEAPTTYSELVRLVNDATKGVVEGWDAGELPPEPTWTMVGIALREVQRLTRDRTVKDSRTVALPDPADVPKGEVWIVRLDGKEGVGVRSDPGSTLSQWKIESFDIHGDIRGWYHDNRVTLISRLVPDVRRVIDRPEDLDALPGGSIVRTESGNTWSKGAFDDWHDGRASSSSGHLLRKYGPVTVIHEPMVDSGSDS